MNARESQLLWERGLQFLGGQTAKQSHEVTNVLNIINEMAGLMSDLLYAADEGRPLDTGRLQQLTQKIAAQVQRGEKIVRNINRFAHSADTPLGVFDVKTALERVCFIADRPARLGKTSLDTGFPAETIALENNPLGFQQAVFTCIEVALLAATQTRRITVSYKLPEQGVRITIHSADPMIIEAPAAAKLAFLEQLVPALGGDLVTRPNAEDPHRLVLFFPRAQPAENPLG